MDREDKKRAYELIELLDFGRAVHDFYLNALCEHLPRYRPEGGLISPKLFFDQSNYLLDGNTRLIAESPIETERTIRARFEDVLSTTPLLLVAYPQDVAHQLARTMSTGYLQTVFRCTSLDDMPVTFRVDLDLFSDQEEFFRPVSERQTLRYLHSPPVGDLAFEVVDV